MPYSPAARRVRSDSGSARLCARSQATKRSTERLRHIHCGKRCAHSKAVCPGRVGDSVRETQAMPACALTCWECR